MPMTVDQARDQYRAAVENLIYTALEEEFPTSKLEQRRVEEAIINLAEILVEA